MEQVTATSKSAWFRLYQISKIIPYFSIEETKSIVYGYVTSRIDQYNSLLVRCPDSLINRIKKVQNAAVKLIFKANKFDHVARLLKELHWLPAPERIIFKVPLLTYKAFYDEGPVYRKDLLKWHLPKRSRLKTYGDQAFQVAAPSLWNS